MIANYINNHHHHGYPSNIKSNIDGDAGVNNKRIKHNSFSYATAAATMSMPPPPPQPPLPPLPNIASSAATTKASATTAAMKGQIAASGGFRQKVSTANDNAICTTTSSSIGRRSVRQLLVTSDKYAVPIFQRRYCWTTTQWETLWGDFTKQRQSKLKHSLGRLTCTDVSVSAGDQQQQRSIIIDGQQRFTTLTLILAAIRDAALEAKTQLLQKEQEAQQEEKVAAGYDRLIRTIHSMLFLDVEKMEQWLIENDDDYSNSDALREDGIELPFCRLLPTYCDRNSYVAAILPSTSKSVQDFISTTYDRRIHRPMVAKQYFASKIDAYLKQKQKNQQPILTSLESLMRSLLDGVDMLYFPINVSRGYQDGTEDPTVIYERLAVRDATFCKPQRSTEYAAMDGSDMIRNLLLGNFDSRTAKTNFYVTVWLPIERFVQRSVPDHYDDDNNESSKTATNSSVTTMKSLLTEFLSNEAKQMTEEDLQRLKQRMRTFKTASSNVGVGGSLYKNFECWMTTHDADQFQKSDDSIDNDSTSSSTSFSERHTLDVGRRLLEYATTKLSS